MDLVLVRYAEMGLKSRAVRKRFENILVENMMSAMAGAGLEGIVRTEQGRVFVQTDQVADAVKVLCRVFGVSSVSPVVQASSEIEEMKRAVASYSLDLMREGRSFAVRARRTGEHPYTSMELGKELGSAIWLANEDKRPRVDLKHPDLEFYVEVRDKKAYIFSQYVDGPGGLPMGSQGRAVALLEEERDALAAWLIMKRGCRVIGIGQEDSEPVRVLRRWDPEMRLVPPGDLADLVKRHRAVAAVFGYGIQDFQKIKTISIPAPAFFPVIGMTKQEIEERIAAIRA
jgi:thiamine biosynthesis protein ThiI